MHSFLKQKYIGRKKTLTHHDRCFVLVTSWKVDCPPSHVALKVISRSPKVSNPIHKRNFFLVANSPQQLTSTPKRKETNWSLPAPAPLYPQIMPPLHRLLGPTSFPQIALRGLSTVSELSRQPVRISEDQSSCRRRGSVMAPLRPAAHFDYLVSHNQPPTGPVWCHAIS